MNIAVCIKQVPDSNDVRVDPETKTMIRQGVESIINPFDAYALEEAVRIRERLGEGKVTVITMGPPQAEAALREAISLGADEAVLVTSRAFAGADTWATSLVLALALRKLNPDLILAGKQSVDSDTAQVGPGIACHMDLPQTCYVSKIRDIARDKAVVERLMDTGKEVLEVTLPAVFTVVKEINEPRLASFKGKMRAKKAEITVWDENALGVDPDDVGLRGSPTIVDDVYNPPRREGGCEFVEAACAAEAAKIVVDRLRELKIVQ